MSNGNPRTARLLFPSLFCRRYDPGTDQTVSCAYRLGMNRYEPLETALAELLDVFNCRRACPLGIFEKSLMEKHANSQLNARGEVKDVAAPDEKAP